MSRRPARKHALKLRARSKAKKPQFRRQESWRYKRVSQVWQKPDGIDSKMRRKVKGWPASAEIGYRGPREARHLHPSGYEEIIVRNVDDLTKVDPDRHAVRIAHTVGMKKRAEISVRAEERHIHLVNPLPKEKPIEEEEAEEEATAERKVEKEASKKEKEAEVGAETEAAGDNMKGKSAEASED